MLFNNFPTKVSYGIGNPLAIGPFTFIFLLQNIPPRQPCIPPDHSRDCPISPEAPQPLKKDKKTKQKVYTSLFPTFNKSPCKWLQITYPAWDLIADGPQMKTESIMLSTPTANFLCAQPTCITPPLLQPNYVVTIYIYCYFVLVTI